MRYQQDLQLALRERYRRLMTANSHTISHEIHLVTDWIAQEAALRAILVEAELAEPGLDFPRWAADVANYGVRFAWPNNTESGRAVLGWKLMQRIRDGAARGNQDAAFEFTFPIGRLAGDLDSTRPFVQMILQPMFDFLGEKVGDDGSVLYVLERYVRRVEWFDRAGLYARFEADTRNGEEVYNLDLQRFLFLEGNYIAHAKPRSASGEVDLAGEVDGDHALICDGKIFDGSGRGKLYLAKGVHQVIQYAQDYQKNSAYLAVFNITGRPLKFPTAAPSETWPPYLEISGIRVYFIHVRALPPGTTASKAGKAKPIEITQDDLVNPDTAP